MFIYLYLVRVGRMTSPKGLYSSCVCIFSMTNKDMKQIEDLIGWTDEDEAFFKTLQNKFDKSNDDFMIIDKVDFKKFLKKNLKGSTIIINGKKEVKL